MSAPHQRGDYRNMIVVQWVGDDEVAIPIQHVDGELWVDGELIGAVADRAGWEIRITATTLTVRSPRAGAGLRTSLTRGRADHYARRRQRGIPKMRERRPVKKTAARRR